MKPLFKANMELENAGGDQIIIKGKKLSCRWIDSYLLVWSQEDHPYDK